jgi:hypothetical protein
MTAPRLTWHQAYPGGRIRARLGDIDIGAVFPPVGEGQHRYPWVWRFWIGTVTTPRQEGRGTSEQAAKNGLTARVADWMREAGVEQVQHE